MSILSIIFISIILVFIPVMVWILFILITKGKSNKFIFLSSFKQFFKNKTTSIIVVVFFGVTFGVVAGANSYSHRLANGVQEAAIDKTAFHAVASAKNIFNDESIVEPDDWDSFSEQFNNNIALFDILSSLGEESADIIANNEVLYKLEKTYTYTPLNSIATGLSFHFIGLDSDYKFEDSLEQENFYNTSSTGKTINELTVHQGDINDVYMDEDGYQDYGNGTILNPYKIAINKEFVEINKNYNMGDMITIDSNFYEIVATVSMPNYLYPVHSWSKFVSDMRTQPLVVIDTNVLNEVFGSENLTYNIFLGFENEFNTGRDISYFTDDSTHRQINSLSNQVNEWMVDNGFENDRGFDPYFTFNTLESVRFYSIFSQVHYANRTNLVMSMIFLGIVTFVLILLISKRIKDSSKQIGTLKALGMKNSSIASSYILSPLLIILFGTFIAIAISIPVQMIWISTFTSFYTINSGVIAIPFSSFILVTFIPFLILSSISFLIALRRLRVNSIVLLSGEAVNVPNTMVLATGFLFQKMKSFKLSYQTKTLFKGMGKSTLIFFSVFSAVFLTGFAVSSSSMASNAFEHTTKMYLPHSDQFTSIEEDANAISVSEFNQMEANGDVIEYTLGINRIYEWGDTNVDTYDIFLTDVSEYILDTPIWETGEENSVYVIPSRNILHISLNYGIWVRESLANGQVPWENDPGIAHGVSGEMLHMSDLSSIMTSHVFSIAMNMYYEPDSQSPPPFTGADNITEWVIDMLVWLAEEAIRGHVELTLVIDDFIYDEEHVTPTYRTSFAYEHFNNIGVPLYSSLAIEVLDDPEDIEKIILSDPSIADSFENYDGKFEGVKVLPIYTATVSEQIMNDNVDPVGYDQYGNRVYEVTSRDSSQAYWTESVVGETFYISPIEQYESYITLGRYTTRDQAERVMGPTNTGYYSSFKHSSTSTSIPYSTIKFGADGQNLERLTVDMLNDIMIVSLPRIHKDLYLTQAEKVYEILTASLLMFAVFGLFIALSLILISSKELIGNARREVSMLKAFGFSNAKASSLVMTPNIWIMLLAFLIAMPLSLIALSALAALLTAMTGTAVILTLTFAQLATISAFLIGVFGLIYLLGFLSFRRVNPIEAISASND